MNLSPEFSHPEQPQVNETELRNQQTADIEADLDQRIAAMGPRIEENRAINKQYGKTAAEAEAEAEQKTAMDRRAEREDAYVKAYYDTFENQGIHPQPTITRAPAEKDSHSFVKERFDAQSGADWFAPQEGADLFAVEAEAAGERAVARVDRGHAFHDAHGADDWDATRNVLDEAYAAAAESGDLEEFMGYFKALRGGERDAYLRYRNASDQARATAETKSFDEHVNDALNLANEASAADQPKETVKKKAPELTDKKDKEQGEGDSSGQTKTKESAETTMPDEGTRAGSEPTDDGLTPAMREANKRRTQLEASWLEAAKKRASIREERLKQGPIRAMGVDENGRLPRRLQDRMRSPEQIAQLLGLLGEENLARARRERADAAGRPMTTKTVSESSTDAVRNQPGRIKKGARSVFGRIRGAAGRVRGLLSRNTGQAVAAEAELRANLDRAQPASTRTESVQTTQGTQTQERPTVVSLEERRKRVAREFASSPLGQRTGRGANAQSGSGERSKAA